MTAPTNTPPAEPATPEGDTTPPEGGNADGDTPTPEAPEGANDPGAVSRAIAAEREAARAARAEARDSRATAEALETERDGALAAQTEAETGRTTAEGERDAALATLMRYEVAADAGLDLDAATRLTGDTREELAADAADFVKRYGGAATAADFDLGVRTSPPTKGTPEEEHARWIAGLLSPAAQ